MADDNHGPDHLGLHQTIFEATPHGYLVLDPDMTIVDVNQQYLELTGALRRDLLGVHVFDA